MSATARLLDREPHAPRAERRGRPSRGALNRVGVAAVVAAIVAVAIPGHSPLLAAGADQITFGTPSGTAVLDQPLELTTTFTSPVDPRRVELLSHLPSEHSTTVEGALFRQVSGDSYSATLTDDGHVLPNTTLDYQFRVTLPDGSTALGPSASITVTDNRFQWKTLEGDIVRLHYYQGDDTFAQRAVQIGDAAIHGAEQLLGVTETEKVDFYIYADQDAFRDALGPGTRENVGGEAIAAIRTMFGLIEPSQINSDWVSILVTHELTHLVFNTAVDNPYHQPPRWLNEGLAVFRSQGYVPSDQALVAQAAGDGAIIPLDGLTGLFPTGDGFALAYAEAVSAVSYIVKTYGQDALVKLIRSYASGVTDDEAFTAAIGRDMKTLGAEWLTSVDATAPQPVGPQPAPPGPVPPGWTSVRVGGLLPLLR